MKEVLIDGIRYVPAEPQVDPLAEVKKAFNAGQTIQFRWKSSFKEEDWHDANKDDGPIDWSAPQVFRIKLEPKPDVVVYGRAFRSPLLGNVENAFFSTFIPKRFDGDNLCLTFDGETKKLKRAEVLQ